MCYFTQARDSHFRRCVTEAGVKVLDPRFPLLDLDVDKVASETETSLGLTMNKKPPRAEARGG